MVFSRSTGELPSRCSPEAQHRWHRLHEDPDVHPNRPTVHVLDIERDHVLDGQPRAAAHLPETGKPWLDREAIKPVMRVVLDFVGDSRPRTDEQHLALENVPQLGKLIKAR